MSDLRISSIENRLDNLEAENTALKRLLLHYITDFTPSMFAEPTMALRKLEISRAHAEEWSDRLLEHHKEGRDIKKELAVKKSVQNIYASAIGAIKEQNS